MSNFCFVLFVFRALQVTLGSLESYDGNCNVIKLHIKIDLRVKLSLLRNSIFYVSRIAKNSWLVVNLIYESFTPSFGR